MTTARLHPFGVGLFLYPDFLRRMTINIDFIDETVASCFRIADNNFTLKQALPASTSHILAVRMRLLLNSGKCESMQVRVQCPACNASFEVPAALVGRDGECSKCRNVFRVTPLSGGDIDHSVLGSSNSNATLEMPIVDVSATTADTDEFEIPDIPEPPTDSSEPETHEREIPEMDIPELDLSAVRETGTQSSDPPGKRTDEDIPVLDTTEKETSTDEPPAILVEDDGSLFGDELPELEDVPEPVSRYASEDEVDPDAGGSYSLSGSSSSPPKRKAQKARRKKATKKKTASRKGRRSNVAEGDSRATSDHGLEEVDDIQLFDDVLHDDDDDGSGTGSSPVMLRRSGTFSTRGKSSGGSNSDSASRRSKKRGKRRPSADEGDSQATTGGKPVLKRRSSEERATGSVRSAAEAKHRETPTRRAKRKFQPMSQDSQRKLKMIAGGGVALLALAGLFSHLTSGPTVITPTFQGRPTGSASPQTTGPAPVPNRDGSTIQTGQTNSSVARANRIRSGSSPPRRIDAQTENANDRTDAETKIAESNPSETAASPSVTEIPGGQPSIGTAPDETASNKTGVVARPVTSPLTPVPAVPTGAATDSANFQTDDDKLFPVDTVAIPKFPDLGTPRASTISGVVFHEIEVGVTARNQNQDDDPLPGSQMNMILYLPSGTHEPGSLPCVMIAAAGTTLLEGNGCFDESYQSETIPYVKQGFAVLGYSLDGPLASDKPTNRESKAAYTQFRAAYAGLVNSRNALEFLLQKVPAINRDRIFTAGHSSAGTLSLLFAEHESRLAGCVAYAPIIDVEKRLSEYISNPLVEVLLPDVEQFVRQESPQRHIKSLSCPVFLFHAKGDVNVPFDESQQFAAQLADQETPCQLNSIPDGDHYQAMLEEGIPRGIVWLKNTAIAPAADATTPSRNR